MDRGPGASSKLFTRHFSQDCTQAEREAQAVTAADLLAALKAGLGLDLEGAVVTGDLALDQLPTLTPEAVFKLPPPIPDIIPVDEIRNVRLIAGPVRIKDSLVRGSVKTDLAAGLLVIAGPVTAAGTTFERALDLSHVAFEGPVDFSRATLQRQGFFIRAWFGPGATFEEATFGTHTRFHRAHFVGPVTFHRSAFNGLAEFLEVRFGQEARFAGTSFKLGTGFSGSRFEGRSDFSDARFEREAFFTFTLFGQGVDFRRTSFGGTADFSDAEFRGTEDFSNVLFAVEPRFVGTKLAGGRSIPRGLQEPWIMYAMVATATLLMAWFVYLLKKPS